MNTIEKEKMIKEWFQAWFYSEWDAFEEVFTDDIYYSESWGPHYYGIQEIRRWFQEWHTKSKLITWNTTCFYHSNENTIVEWNFCCESKDKQQAFDGVSVIEWKEDKIHIIKEYASTRPHYHPFK